MGRVRVRVAVAALASLAVAAAGVWFQSMPVMVAAWALMAAAWVWTTEELIAMKEARGVKKQEG